MCRPSAGLLHCRAVETAEQVHLPDGVAVRAVLGVEITNSSLACLPLHRCGME